MMTNCDGRFVLTSLLLAALIVAGCSPASKKQSLLTRADNSFKNKKFEEAKIDYLNVIKIDYTNAYAMRRVGEICYAEGEPRPALAYLTKAAETYKDDLGLATLIAKIYLAGNNSKEAGLRAQAILAKDPTNDEAIVVLADSVSAQAEIEKFRTLVNSIRAKTGDRASAHVALGSLLAAEGKLKEAEVEFNLAVTKDPKFLLGYRALASYYAAANDVEKANKAYETAVQLSDQKSGIKLVWAEYLIRTGKMAEAQKLVEEVRTDDPDHLPGLVHAAQFAYREKRYDDSLAMAKRVLARDTMNYRANLLVAHIHVQKKNNAAAIEVMENLAAKNPQVPQVHFELAEAYLMENQVAKAIGSLQRAVSLAPAFTEATLRLAELQIAKEDYIPAISALSNLLKLQPKARQAYLLLANAYIARGSTGEALDVYRRCAALFPKDAMIPYLTGFVYRQTGNNAKARASFEAAVALDSEMPQAVEQLIELDVLERAFQPALSKVEKLEAKFPKLAAPKILLATVALAEKKEDRAEAALLQAIELEPTLIKPYLMLSKLYVNANKREKALERLNAVVAKNPNARDAFMQIGIIHNSAKEYKKAAEAYEKALSVDSKFVPALNNLAYLNSERLGLFDKAHELARTARDLRPYDPYTADTLGWVLFRKGQYSRSMGLVRQTFQQLPSEPEVLYHLGAASYQLGEEDSARQNLSAALAGGRDFPGKEDAEARRAILDVNPAKKDPAAAALLTKRLAEDGNDLIALLRQGEMEELAGASEKAVALYKRALAVSPTATTVSVRLAMISADKVNDLAGAIEVIKAARATAPDDVVLTATMGRLNLRKGEFKQALALLEEGAGKLPNVPEVKFDLAWAYFAFGRLGEASAEMRKLAGLGGKFGRIEEVNRFLAMTDLLLDSKPVKSARESAERVLKLDPNCAPALAVTAAALEREKNLAGAAESYRKLVDQYPFYAPGLKRLAILTGGVDDKASFGFGSRARALLTDDPELPQLVGMSAFRSGNFEAAIPLLTRAAELDPKDADSLYHLGLALGRQNRLKESRETLQRALKLNLKPEFAQEAKRLVADSTRKN